MSNEHTPTPWKVEHGHMQQNIGIRYWQITDGQDAICNNQFCCAEDSEANAAHIVKCVNMHDELVEVLELARRDLADWIKATEDDDNWLLWDTRMIINRIRETLKKAGAL